MWLLSADVLTWTGCIGFNVIRDRIASFLEAERVMRTLAMVCQDWNDILAHSLVCVPSAAVQSRLLSETLPTHRKDRCVTEQPVDPDAAVVSPVTARGVDEQLLSTFRKRRMHGPSHFGDRQ